MGTKLEPASSPKPVPTSQGRPFSTPQQVPLLSMSLQQRAPHILWLQRAGAAGPAAAASGGGSGKKGRDASYLLNFRCAERREAARPVIPARFALLAIACVSTVAEQPALTPRRGAGGGARSCASTRTASCRPITGESRLPLRPLASCLALSLIVVHRLRGRFVVADGDYSVELAMPDKMVEWDVIREVRIRVGVGARGINADPHVGVWGWAEHAP